MDADDPIDAIRRRPVRLAVISKGRVVAVTKPPRTTLSLMPE
jgi:cytosine deaminase